MTNAAAPSERGYAAIGLHQPKNISNMGEIMRAAGCYGVSMVTICGRRFQHSHIDTQRAWKHLPTIDVPDLLAAVPFGAIPVAVEFIPTATPLPAFVHPERAYYLFGPEDGSLPAATVARCQHVVYVPSRHCMNLAATANVLLYDRMVKRQALAAQQAVDHAAMAAKVTQQRGTIFEALPAPRGTT